MSDSVIRETIDRVHAMLIELAEQTAPGPLLHCGRDTGYQRASIDVWVKPPDKDGYCRTVAIIDDSEVPVAINGCGCWSREASNARFGTKFAQHASGTTEVK